MSFRETKSLDSSTLLINFWIYAFFSLADLMVAYDTFFLLNSSKLSGIPVIKQNSGIIIVLLVSVLLRFSTISSGCLPLLMVRLYFFVIELPQSHLWIFQFHLIDTLETHVDDPQIPSLPVVCHDGLANQLILNDVSFFFSVFFFVHLVDVIDIVEDGLIPNDLSGWVYSKIYPILELHKICFDTTEHF